MSALLLSCGVEAVMAARTQRCYVVMNGRMLEQPSAAAHHSRNQPFIDTKGVGYVNKANRCILLV